MRLEINGDEFFADLLFYHLKLRCYVVIELKAVKFDPGFLGYAQRDVMPKYSFALAF